MTCKKRSSGDVVRRFRDETIVPHTRGERDVEHVGGRSGELGEDGTFEKTVGGVVGGERMDVLDEPRELIRRGVYRVLVGVF